MNKQNRKTKISYKINVVLNHTEQTEKRKENGNISYKINVILIALN